MFNGYDRLHLKNDCLNLSYRQVNDWPAFTPKGTIRSFVFDIGDEVKGPVVQLGLISPVADEKLDWRHSIDPPHFHGSDQFRFIIRGEWILAGKKQVAGAYSLQESGQVYREHPTPDCAAWVMLVIGDRRGAKPEIIQTTDVETLIDIDNEYFKPSNDDEPLHHPAGVKGITAIHSTDGVCSRGYLRKNAAELSLNTGSTHLFGDQQAGPVAYVLNYAPNSVVLAKSCYATERFLTVSTGSCDINGVQYQAGDIRIQNAGHEMGAVMSGSEGVTMAMVVADRRASVVFDQSKSKSPGWLSVNF